MPDIGDVDDVRQVIALVAQHAAERIGEHIGTHIANMLEIIDRWPASVDLRLTLFDGRERFKRTGKAIVKVKRHAALPARQIAPPSTQSLRRGTAFIPGRANGLIINRPIIIVASACDGIINQRLEIDFSGFFDFKQSVWKL